MPDVVQIRLKIGGVDYGQAGSPRLLIPGGRITAGDLTHIGDATIALEGGPGVDAGILNQAYVEWYLWNVTQNRIPAKGRWFCGWVAARETGQNPGTTEKTWSLPCQDINLLWEALVAKAAWAQGIHLAAGTFAAQIAALFAAFGTGLATRQVDATSQVLNLTGSAILPPCDFTGPMLRDMIGVLFANARKVNPLLRPTACLTPDPTIGAVGSDTFGSPVLWVWDLAHPPAPGQQYTTGTPDSTHAAILPERPVQRRLTSARFANWGQAQTPTGRVYTSAHAASVATYPGNPYDPDGVWKRPAYRDTQHTGPTANATGTAAVAGGAVTGVTMGLNGTGYTEAPLVVFGGPGTGAAGVANMGGYLLRLDVTAQGTGYTSAPTVGISGGGGTGAAATATVDAAGHVTALTITNPGTNYTSAPTISLTGGGGSGAAGTATIGGKVLSVTMLTGGTGYSSAPSVTFADAIQAALDAQVEQGALPRETVPISSRTPTLAGTYAGLTLTLEGGLVEVAYPVASLELDLTRPQDPIYTMQCGSRTLRLGESPGTADTFAPPVEGVRLSPPANFAQTNAFQRAVGNTRVTYTFDAPTPPPGVILDHYDLHVLVDTLWYVTAYPGSSPGVILNDVNPGSTLQAYLVAVGRAGGRLIESFPTPTLGPFAVAAQWDPDPPTGLAVFKHGQRLGRRWFQLSFTPPGTTHGPHDVYEVDVQANGVTVGTYDFLDPGGSPTILPAIDNLTPGVTYSARVRTVAGPRWFGTAYTPLLTIPPILLGPGPLPVDGGGEPAPDALLWPFFATAGTATPTVDSSDTFDGAAAYKVTSAGADVVKLTGIALPSYAGEVSVVRTAAKKSGGSPTLGGAMQYDDGSGTWVLTPSTLTLPALTTSWPTKYTEQQMISPATTKFKRLVYTFTFAAATTILAALPQPTPALSTTDTHFLTASGNPIALYDSTGALRGSIYADGNAPDLIHLHSVTTGGVNSGWGLDSTYGDNLQVGDAAANGGISLVPASGKLLTLSGSGEKLNIQSIVETRGSSFPGSPATGDRHYRTDLHEWAYWDGARWLSETLSELRASQRGTFPQAAGVATLFDATIPGDAGVHFERWDIDAYVVTTNNVSNYWTLIGLVDDGAGGRTGIASVTTSGISANVFRPLSTTSFSGNNYAAGAKIMFGVDSSLTGAPGSIYLSGLTIRYRRILT